MGSISQILEMMPGKMGAAVGKLDPKDTERQFRKTEAIINSMTKLEKNKPEILNASRRRRIAKGSGTEVQDVNRLSKQFREAKNMMNTLKKSGAKGLKNLFQ